jgi:hypothetical protein
MASRLTATPGQIAFDIYGPMVHLQLLSTPPRGDAVTFGFRPESVSLGRTCTSLIEYTLRRTGPAALGCTCLADTGIPNRDREGADESA